MIDEESVLTRAFVCLELSDDCVKEIARVQDLVGKRRFQGKMTELWNIHLTLKFLGELDDEKLKEVQQRLSKVNFNEFEVSLGEIGTFSSHGRPRIVWIKLNGKEVWELQKKIDESLSGMFPKEERFMSHITIARIKYVNDAPGFIKATKNIKISPIKFKVKEFKLKKSDLQETGPVYTDISPYTFSQ